MPRWDKRQASCSALITSILILLLIQVSPAQSAPVSGQSMPASQITILGAVDSATPLPNGVVIRSGSATARIEALRDDIVRVRITPTGAFPEDASWAVLPETRGKSVAVEPAQDQESVGFRTKILEVRVERSPFRLIVRDLQGKVIAADAQAKPPEFRHGGFAVYKDMPDDEHYYALGDKTGGLDRREQSFSLWNTDAYGFQESTDPIYKAIPFFLALQNGRSYGIFLDNTWRTTFDFGKAARRTYSFGSDGGPLDYYFLYGPEPKQVVEAYAYLTGLPPLPPLWTFGFQQSRYSYTPASRLREIARKLRADKIPSDVLYLDIDFQDRHRPFTVDPKAFPDFPKLIADLRQQHFRLVTITDLHIAHAPNQGYAPYDTGAAGDHFVKNPDGTTFVGVVWPGPSVFPDFTRQASRKYWGGLYSQFYAQGVAGFWNDMNEPSVFNGPGKTMPLETVHRIEEPGFTTRTATHAEIHNVYGMENARATYEGLLALKPDERPFVLTRATYAGGQRYGATWTGDNSSTWNHLRLSVFMLLNLGLSGVPFVGADVGGFTGGPQPELLTKWLELAAFTPFYRDHAQKFAPDAEVWVHGPEQEAIRRKYIEERYRLLPYIYTLAEESSRTGVPMVRPLFLEFPNAASSPGERSDTEFLLGPDLLIYPPSYPDTLIPYNLSLPKGDWYDYWTGARVVLPPPPSQAEDLTTGTASYSPPTIRPQLDVLPVFVREGAILPRQPLIQSTDEIPSGPLELNVYPGQDCKGSIYTDDGHTFGYRRGDFLRQSFTCAPQADGIKIHLGAREGSYAPWWRTIDVVVYNWPSAQAIASTNAGTSLVTKYDAGRKALHVVVPENAQGNDLTVVSGASR